MESRPHSPEELAELSTLIHNLAGWFFLALAIAMIVELLRGTPTSRWRFAWPALGMFIGYGLTIFIFTHQVFYHEVSPFSNPAQNQHQLIGVLTAIGSTFEVLRRRRNSHGRLWRSAFPLAIVGVGVAFLVHEQGTPEALIAHWALAGTLILAGLALVSGALAGEDARAVCLLGMLLLVTAAAQLILFKEDPGAHGGHGSGPAAAEGTVHHSGGGAD